jgi:thioredoxin-like negative regulator of GroEL
MLNEQELKQIRDQFAFRSGPLRLTFHPCSSDEPFSSMLAEVAETAARAAGEGIVLERAQGGVAPATPALTITGPGRGAIAYLALPEGLEAAPFIEALDPAERVSEEGVEAQLQAIDQPAEIWVFIAQACPHCPQAVRAANRLARASEKISATIIDAQRFTDLAARFKIQSVPATVLDQQLRITGVIPPDKLLRTILQRDSPEFRSSVLLSLIESARFSDAGAHVLKESGPADFLALWSKSSTSSRMGLMLVMEEVLAKNAGALNGIVDGLIDLLKTQDTPLRGDTADLLGQIGDIRAQPALQALLSDPNPDVAEIAAEALDKVK